MLKKYIVFLFLKERNWTENICVKAISSTGWQSNRWSFSCGAQFNVPLEICPGNQLYYWNCNSCGRQGRWTSRTNKNFKYVHLLLTEFEVRTVNYGPIFSPSIYGPSAKRAGHKSQGKSKAPWPAHEWIAQSQVYFCLCSKTSLCAKLLVWKYMSPVRSFSWKSSHFHVKRLAQALVLKEQAATQKWK